MSTPLMRITVRPNGPIMVTGPLELVDPAGNVIVVPPGKIIPLCRCGISKMKPYCDGGHNGCGFTSKDPAPPRP